MKNTLIYGLGATTASSWWAAAIWGYEHTEHGDLSGLWIAPVVLTLLTLALAIMKFLDEQVP
jgi:hypothetical protein